MPLLDAWSWSLRCQHDSHTLSITGCQNLILLGPAVVIPLFQFSKDLLEVVDHESGSWRVNCATVVGTWVCSRVSIISRVMLTLAPPGGGINYSVLSFLGWPGQTKLIEQDIVTFSYFSHGIPPLFVAIVVRCRCLLLCYRLVITSLPLAPFLPRRSHLIHQII